MERAVVYGAGSLFVIGNDAESTNNNDPLQYEAYVDGRASRDPSESWVRELSFCPVLLVLMMIMATHQNFYLP
jgi:hypothetical protein